MGKVVFGEGNGYKVPMDWILFLLTYVGALALYLFARCRGFAPFSVCFAVNIGVGKKASPRVIIIDALLTSLIGSIIAFAVTAPSTNPQAITAGLSFTGIINAFATKDE